MDLGPIGQAVGAIGLAAGLVLALVRYLTSDGGYRDLISELRSDNADLRVQLEKVHTELIESDKRAQKREAELMGEIRRLQAMVSPGPPWPPPGAAR